MYHFDTANADDHIIAYSAVTDNNCIPTWSTVINYIVDINGSTYTLPVGKPSDEYPQHINGKNAIWNWIDNGHDFCYFLWEILGERTYKDEESADEEESVCYSMIFYSQTRLEEPEPQLIAIFNKMEELGYIKSYTIRPDKGSSLWRYRGKKDGTIDLALVDESFKNNSLLMEQIELWLWSTPEEIKQKPYFLTDKVGRQIMSEKPGQYGGHNTLKIYGRLDCPSALRHIGKGQYVRHRVFFIDEDTAITAGYRPCGVCMKAAYSEWKKRGACK